MKRDGRIWPNVLASILIAFLVIILSPIAVIIWWKSEPSHNYKRITENPSVEYEPAPGIEWSKCLGGSGKETYGDFQVTPDGGYIVAGTTMSDDGDVSGNHSDFGLDCWVVKLDASGKIIWQRRYGGSKWDECNSIRQTADGGYIFAGYTKSDDGDVAGNHGGEDIWVVKLDSAGDIVWQKCLGGSGYDRAFSVRQTAAGGYIVAGYTYSNDGDVSGNHGESDFWVVKLASSGAIEWQKCIGGDKREVARSIEETTDEGLIIAGETFSNNGDITENHGWHDCLVIKLDSSGNIIWQKSLGGSGRDLGRSAIQTFDGGYIVAGVTSSGDGDASGGGYHYSILRGRPCYDAWIIKLDTKGDIEWQKCFGGYHDEGAYSIQQTADGGYIAACTASSIDGDVIGNHGNGNLDIWILKLDYMGGIVWQKCLGGGGNEGKMYEGGEVGVRQLSDGSYAVCGQTDSPDGDVKRIHGKSIVKNFFSRPEYDIWIVKLAGDGGISKTAISLSILICSAVLISIFGVTHAVRKYEIKPRMPKIPPKLSLFLTRLVCFIVLETVALLISILLGAILFAEFFRASDTLAGALLSPVLSVPLAVWIHIYIFRKFFVRRIIKDE